MHKLPVIYVQQLGETYRSNFPKRDLFGGKHTAEQNHHLLPWLFCSQCMHSGFPGFIQNDVLVTTASLLLKGMCHEFFTRRLHMFQI